MDIDLASSQQWCKNRTSLHVSRLFVRTTIVPWSLWKMYVMEKHWTLCISLSYGDLAGYFAIWWRLISCSRLAPIASESAPVFLYFSLPVATKIAWNVRKTPGTHKNTAKVRSAIFISQFSTIFKHFMKLSWTDSSGGPCVRYAIVAVGLPCGSPKCTARCSKKTRRDFVPQIRPTSEGNPEEL